MAKAGRQEPPSPGVSIYGCYKTGFVVASLEKPKGSKGHKPNYKPKNKNQTTIRLEKYVPCRSQNLNENVQGAKPKKKRPYKQHKTQKANDHVARVRASPAPASALPRSRCGARFAATAAPRRRSRAARGAGLADLKPSSIVF